MRRHVLSLSRHWRALLALLVVMCTSVPAFAQAGTQLVAVPPFRSFVTDLSNALQPDESAQLEARLSEIEQQSGSQIAVLLLPTTRPEDIATYAIRVAEAWKPGRKKVDDGVLLVVATQDRRVRIEVGRGLEGAIPDVTAKRIISETITPAFKEGRTYAGIAAGVEQIAASIKGEALPPPPVQRASDNEHALGALLPLLIVIAIIVMGFLRRSGGGAYYASRRGNGLANFATGAVLGSILGGGRNGGGGFGGGGGGGWSGGGGGGFGGGGASGSW